MIVGVFIKGYKTYQHLTFVPLLNNHEHKLSIFIGKNGAGKSSIQEALDTLFNDRPWNQNVHSKKGEGYICPVFLISKRERINSKVIPLVSEYFWSYETPSNTGVANFDPWNDFVAFRSKLATKVSQNDYHLVVIGINEERDISYTNTHERLKNSFKPKGIGYSDHDKCLGYILDRYRYVYLPIHNSPTSLVELKARELQALLDKNFIKEIEKILNKDDDNASPLKNINEHLNRFLDEINLKLKSIDENYQYGSAQNHKITTEDITDIILNKYLSRRPLQKDGKSIESLSSGEQRMTIIDVALAFLSKSTETNKELIISIDEPESSLSPTNCLKQFKKIFQISNKFHKQTIISTHWYGLLMTPTDATLNHISREQDRPAIRSLDLSRIQEERRNFPDSFEMKSYFDLVSSILSITKGEKQNWLICEGQDDQNYINAYVKDEINNFNILPIGGKGGVRKIYEYLRIAAEDKSERNLIQGKILCIIDSDPEITPISIPSAQAKQHLKILRFQITQKGVADLVEPTAAGHYTETELEDVLDSLDYYNAARYVIRRRAPEDVKVAFSECVHNQGSTYAGINYGLSFISPKTLIAHEGKQSIKNFLTSSESKAEISKVYRASKPNPSWVERITLFFNDPYAVHENQVLLEQVTELLPWEDGSVQKE